MGSTRLPGKVLMNADPNNLMINYTINQLKNCKISYEFIIATSNLERDDVLAKYCESQNVNVFRGDEKQRHHQDYAWI